ncbi:MAG TPA: diguanylate cyclase [Pseudoduganella sp.]
MNSSRLRVMRQGLLALAVVFPLVYVYVQYVSARRDQGATIADADSENRQIAAALKEHTARSVGEADRVLQAAMGEVERSGLALTWDNRFALERILRRYSVELPQISKLTIIDGNGKVLAVSGAQLAEPADASDTGYFGYHKSKKEDSLFVTSAYKSKVNDRQVFAITRSLRNENGSLKAVMLCSMRADYFGEFYRTLDAGKGVRVMLVSAGGPVLVESPARPETAARDLSRSPYWAKFRNDDAGSFSTQASMMDGTPRLVAFARVPQFPLLITVAQREDEVLRPWHERRQHALLIGGASILLMLALIGLLWRHLTQLMAAQATLHEQNTALRTLNEELAQQAIVDPLTGLHNRRYFNVVFPREILRARRSEAMLAFCIGDMDHFKKYNDRYGHPQGDEALQQAARLLREAMHRASDYAFRLGGEEFAMLFVAPSADEAWQLVEAARRRVEQLGLPHEDSPAGVATMSFGLVCVLAGAEVDAAGLYSLADNALYEAKAAGRSCTVRKIIWPAERKAVASEPTR